jgi:uncharacterized protein YlxP (DUF503 family)
MNAIHIVEVEAHTSNLTQRMKQLLNVPESEIEDDDTKGNHEINVTEINDDKAISNKIDKEMGMRNSNGTK